MGVRLDWTDNATDEDGSRVERKHEGGSFVLIQTINTPNVQSYIDPSGIVSDTYRVLAFNAFGDSAWSNEATPGYWPASVISPAVAPEFEETFGQYPLGARMGGNLDVNGESAAAPFWEFSSGTGWHPLLVDIVGPGFTEAMAGYYGPEVDTGDFVLSFEPDNSLPPDASLLGVERVMRFLQPDHDPGHLLPSKGSRDDNYNTCSGASPKGELVFPEGPEIWVELVMKNNWGWHTPYDGDLSGYEQNWGGPNHPLTGQTPTEMKLSCGGQADWKFMFPGGDHTNTRWSLKMGTKGGAWAISGPPSDMATSFGGGIPANLAWDDRWYVVRWNGKTGDPGYVKLWVWHPAYGEIPKKTLNDGVHIPEMSLAYVDDHSGPVIATFVGGPSEYGINVNRGFVPEMYHYTARIRVWTTDPGWVDAEID